MVRAFFDYPLIWGIPACAIRTSGIRASPPSPNSGGSCHSGSPNRALFTKHPVAPPGRLPPNSQPRDRAGPETPDEQAQAISVEIGVRDCPCGNHALTRGTTGGGLEPARRQSDSRAATSRAASTEGPRAFYLRASATATLSALCGRPLRRLGRPRRVRRHRACGRCFAGASPRSWG
jgi:hypothetical protein